MHYIVQLRFEYIHNMELCSLICRDVLEIITFSSVILFHIFRLSMELEIITTGKLEENVKQQLLVAETGQSFSTFL